LEIFLRLFDDRALLYFFVISKTEYIINQLLKDYKNNIFKDMDALRYSIVKAIVIYQPQGIIERKINSIKNILTQTRIKANAPHENGLIEIPAGKIRAFENIFDTLKREIKEETGLDAIEIQGENSSVIYEGSAY